MLIPNLSEHNSVQTLALLRFPHPIFGKFLTDQSFKTVSPFL